jgi:pyruvate dehydrogenase E1 component alpha subunit/2-oxoisovalerate dehydrogenase E1 component alpha subunit
LTVDPALGLFRVLDDHGGVEPGFDSSLSDESRLRMFRELVRVRRLDERLTALQRQGELGFHGAAFGQEAVPVGAAFGVETGDWVFPALRESAIMLVRGFPLQLYLAQAFGSAGDVAKGRQMPSHQAGRRVNQVSWSSCIATQLPHAVGMALAARRARASTIALAFLGDGATSHPDFHAALNLAGVLRAGVVFVCQNNQYALSVPAARQTASASFAIKARAYGFPGVRIDGNDVLAVESAVRAAAARARAGSGPTLIECVTYRRGAHSTSDDPSRYRHPEEEREWAARDPLSRFRQHLVSRGLLDETRAAAMLAAIEREIDTALAAARAEPPPALATLWEDVYAGQPWHLVEQRIEHETAHSIDLHARVL